MLLDQRGAWFCSSRRMGILARRNSVGYFLRAGCFDRIQPQENISLLQFNHLVIDRNFLNAKLNEHLAIFENVSFVPDDIVDILHMNM